MNLYLNSLPAPFSPTTFKGSWNKTSECFDCLLDSLKIGASNVAKSSFEVDVNTGYKVCVVRAVSRKLAAGATSTSTANMVLGLLEANADANFFTKCYIWVTTGDTDTVRGVLLDRTETSGGGAAEWPTTAAGKAFLAAANLTDVTWQEGDRIVVEFGYITENVHTTSRAGTVRIGNRGGSGIDALADLAVAGLDVSTKAGFISFSSSITLSATEPTNVTPETATDITGDISTTPYQNTVNPLNLMMPLYWKRTVVASDNLVLRAFFGVSSAVGTYEPNPGFWYESAASVWDEVDGGALVGVDERVVQFLVTLGELYLFRIEAISVVAGSAGRSVVANVTAAPTMPSAEANKGRIFITEDTTGVRAYPAVVIDSDGNTIGMTSVVPSENGAVLANGIFALSDKDIATEHRVAIYDNEFALIGYQTTALTATGSSNVPVATEGAFGTRFYVIQYQIASNKWKLSRISDAAVLGTQWTVDFVTSNALRPTLLGINPAATIAYIGDGSPTNLNTAIKKWNLSSDVTAGTFLAGESGKFFKEVIVSDAGEVLVVVDNATVTLLTVRRYDSSAVLQATYTITTTITSAFLDHIAWAPDQLSFWAWMQGLDADGFAAAEFQRIQLSDGSVLDTINIPLFSSGQGEAEYPDEVEPPTFNGVPDSCPLLTMMSVGTATITVIKETDPAADPQIFTFSSTTLTPSSWTMEDGDSEVFSNLDAGTYDVLEETVPGWSTVYVVSNGDPFNAIVLAEGESVTVTVTNTFGNSNVGSGIYKLVPDKRNDTIWTENFASEEDVEIPNPNAKLGYIGS